MEPGVSVSITNYLNAFWCTMVTMTTVGYGDFYPKSIPGRVIMFVVCILGIVVISLIVFLVTDFLNMNDAEMKVMNIMIRMQKREGVTKEAAFVLSLLAKLLFISKRIKNEKMDKTRKKMKQKFEEIEEKFSYHLQSFKKQSRFLI